MKTNRTILLKVGIGIIAGIAIAFLFAATVHANPVSYHGLTNIEYANRITDQGGWNWNGGYRDRALNPSRSMEQFGLTFWSTYVSCGGNIDYNSYIGYSNPPDTWMMQQNKTSIADGMAQRKVKCPSGQILRGHVNIQHWWQCCGRPGDGRTLSTSGVLSPPP